MSLLRGAQHTRMLLNHVIPAALYMLALPYVEELHINNTDGNEGRTCQGVRHNDRALGPAFAANSVSSWFT